LRASIGNGFAAPTPWMDDVAATDLGTLLPLQGLHAERAVTESLDAKWSDDGWDVNLSVFNSVIRDPLISQSAAGNRIRLLNAPGPRRAPGAEIVVRNVTGLLQILGSWSYIDASETSLSGQRQQVSLVPRHSAELAGIIESEKRGRIGLELAYTGSQTLVDNPYRSVSKPYYELNALGELRIGTVAIFLNAINLTDVRQTHYDPLTRPNAGVGGNPITEAWAPLAGRTFNLGVRAEL
jgi:iron complex outermembrane receptor protein